MEMVMEVAYLYTAHVKILEFVVDPDLQPKNCDGQDTYRALRQGQIFKAVSTVEFCDMHCCTPAL